MAADAPYGHSYQTLAPLVSPLAVSASHRTDVEKVAKYERRIFFPTRQRAYCLVWLTLSCGLVASLGLFFVGFFVYATDCAVDVCACPAVHPRHSAEAGGTRPPVCLCNSTADHTYLVPRNVTVVDVCAHETLRADAYIGWFLRCSIVNASVDVSTTTSSPGALCDGHARLNFDVANLGAFVIDAAGSSTSIPINATDANAWYAFPSTVMMRTPTQADHVFVWTLVTVVLFSVFLLGICVLAFVRMICSVSGR